MSQLPVDRYAVLGNPVAHSRSPWLHARFAELTDQPVQYSRLLAPLKGFAQTVAAMRAAGMKGANVTVPFKFEAYALCNVLTQRAQAAGAVNTLSFTDGIVAGDNTDGAGLCWDLQRLTGNLAGKRILLLGAGGAVAGVVRPLLDAGIASLTLLNRTPEKAHHLIGSLRTGGFATEFRSGGFDTPVHAVDILINGTSTGLSDEAPPIPVSWFAGAQLAYDMMYAARPTAFMRMALEQSVVAADGLGMLVGQAAEAFHVWRGVLPPAAQVLSELRDLLDRQAATASKG